MGDIEVIRSYKADMRNDFLKVVGAVRKYNEGRQQYRGHQTSFNTSLILKRYSKTLRYYSPIPVDFFLIFFIRVRKEAETCFLK